LIFAGPHRSFTKGKDGKHAKMLNAVFLIRERKEMDAEMEQRCYAIGTKEKLGLTVNPHPINEDDILDCNGEVEDDFESCLDNHQRLSSILESQGNVCKLHIELETWRSFQQLIKEQMEPGSVDGFAGECNSPGCKSITALDEGKAKQGIYSGNVVVNAVEYNSPIRDLSTALDRNTSKDDHGVFKARVPSLVMMEALIGRRVLKLTHFPLLWLKQAGV